mmetsp:Transcript_63092/g.124231  ORF Transcript_63092/g.124231 Transcript_63092/m.124231 type:complete len:209 (-) Transcript_63092:230-856(-)
MHFPISLLLLLALDLVPVVHAAPIGDLVQPHAPTRAADEEIYAQEWGTHRGGHTLSHARGGGCMQLQQLDRPVVALISASMAMDNLPSVAVSTGVLARRAADEPSVAPRHLRGGHAAAPPPNAEAGDTPEHHDAQLERGREAHDGLVLRLRDEARAERAKRRALRGQRTLTHEAGDMLVDIINRQRYLGGRRRRQYEHTGSIAQVRRL